MTDKSQPEGILKEVWQKALQELKNTIPAPTFESFLKTSYPLSMAGSTVTLAVSNLMATDVIENKYSATINKTFSDCLGSNVTVKCEYVEPPKKEEETKPAKTTRSRKAKKPEAFENISRPLNNSYTFNNFIVGDSNRFAYACCISVATAPMETYNPLFIYGGSGLGKTHLMCAIGHYVEEKFPDKRVVYVSGENFTYHYVKSLREHKIDEFRRSYRNIDVFLVDDIQFIVGKEHTEEEFFHTFNSIFDEGKQIVLTSDKAPGELKLSPRMVSRFEKGIVTSVAPPNLETRMAILEGKAKAENMNLSPEVILYIAGIATENVRQLEGALVKLHVYTSINPGEEVTVDVAKELLSDYLKVRNEPLNMDINLVVNTVAEVLSVSPEDIMGKERSKSIAEARHISMYLIRNLMELSFQTIGKAFGGKDHSTVVHACEKIEEIQKTDRDVQIKINNIRNKINEYATEGK